jgi:plasmid stabilization system protein ParE
MSAYRTLRTTCRGDSPRCGGAVLAACIGVQLAWIPCSCWSSGHSLETWLGRIWRRFEAARSPYAVWSSRKARRCRSRSSRSRRSCSPSRIWRTSARRKPSTNAERTSPERRSSESSTREPFIIDWSVSAKRQLDQELGWWDQNRTTAYGQLDADVRSALRLLGAQPYIGTRQSSAGTYARRLLLRESGLWMMYRVYPRRRTILITKLVPARRP